MYVFPLQLYHSYIQHRAASGIVRPLLECRITDREYGGRSSTYTSQLWPQWIIGSPCPGSCSVSSHVLNVHCHFAYPQNSSDLVPAIQCHTRRHGCPSVAEVFIWGVEPRYVYAVCSCIFVIHSKGQCRNLVISTSEFRYCERISPQSSECGLGIWHTEYVLAIRKQIKDVGD